MITCILRCGQIFETRYLPYMYNEALSCNIESLQIAITRRNNLLHFECIRLYLFCSMFDSILESRAPIILSINQKYTFERVCSHLCNTKNHFPNTIFQLPIAVYLALICRRSSDLHDIILSTGRAISMVGKIETKKILKLKRYNEF